MFAVLYCTRPLRRIQIQSDGEEPAEANNMSMNAVWILVGIAGLGALAQLVTWSLGQGRKSDLGSVSHQWVAEHRQSQTQERR